MWEPIGLVLAIVFALIGVIVPGWWGVLIILFAATLPIIGIYLDTHNL